MTRFAIISDIHGNMPALDAVLTDLQARDIDQIYCLGDLVDFAPWGNEVIENIKRLGIPCILGNHDERIAWDLEIVPLGHHSSEETAFREIAIVNSKEQIKECNKSFLRQLPYTMLLTFKIGIREWCIHLVHASTRSNEEYIYANHDERDLLSMFEKTDADLLVMGHTHIVYQRTLTDAQGKSRTALNCGSVGRSREEGRKATYVVISLFEDHMEIEVSRLNYKIESVAQAIIDSGIPDFYAQFLLEDRR
ncbi:metallophosphoesterase family protein [Sphingobacterium sp. SYP-B4668]|uniref:metallophosphoesterase family protein n=1 Tax=Sphingobacterium sp. SYP-B4668 TaxID=2996035 RepID=UPI0022DE3E86|nr:metallophosphoesterase [Sphingobacterium sp. SYP-B4668]